jgi:4'-phosphopantetheinyl transferase
VVELPEGEVHLWFSCPDDWEETALIGSARAILEADEIVRSERFHLPVHRRLFLASRILLRTTLSRYAEIPPGAWRFVANDHGKPRVAPEAGLPAPSFNIAHTAGIAVAAVTSGCDVGVDVESRDRHVHARRLADRFFTPKEAADLGELPPAALRDRFFLTWTLKEAYIKALGRGFAQPLDSFTFSLNGERPYRIDLSAEPPQDPWKWRFALVGLRPRFITAVCVAADRSESARLRCYRAFPTGGAAPLVCDPVGLSDGWEVL